MFSSKTARGPAAPGRQLQATRSNNSSLRRQPVSNFRLTDPRYQYVRDCPGLEGIAISSKVPPEESFSVRYVRERIVATTALVYNSILARIALKITKAEDDDMDNLADFKKFFPPFSVKLFGFIPIPVPVPDPSKFVQLPDVASIYEDDAVFGEHRLAGTNPAVLRALKADDPRASIVQDVPGAAEAIAAGKMFVVDYTGRPVGDKSPDWLLPEGGVTGGEYKYKGKTLRKALPLPIAFFKWDDAADGRLLPVAIQLYEDGRLYTPADQRYDWLFAKMSFSIADGNHHEMVSHLAQKHFFMEAFAVATRRCLDDMHPLSLLLRVHTRFLIANNSLGRDTLVAPGGTVDCLLSGTLAESVEMCRLGTINTHFLNDNFVNDVSNRGVGTDAIPRYPYRDNGQKLWDSIRAFVTEYLTVLYSSDEAVKADAQVQMFCAECADPTQGSVNGMPSKADTLEDLVTIVTSIIFYSGPAHCAVNFTQHPVASFVPNMPMAARDPYRELSKRTASQPISEKELVKMLPNEGMVSQQAETMYTLSAYRFDELGYYDRPFDSLFDLTTVEVFDGYPKGEGYLKAIVNFQTKLAEVEEEINLMNSKSPIADEDYLAPSTIINSTSI